MRRGKRLKLSLDGSHSGNKICKQGYGGVPMGVCKREFGKRLETLARFSVDVFGRKIFHIFSCFIKKFNKVVSIRSAIIILR